MRVRDLVARLVMAALVCAAAGCARNSERVGVGIGTAAYVDDDARPFAQLYLPYVEMAALAYADPQFLAGRPTPLCPDDTLLRSPALVDATHSAADNLAAARRLATLRALHWQCLFGGIGPLNCPRAKKCVDGLQYQVWRRNDCGEAVIAFRGSDGGDIGDWISNFRWFLGRRSFDEYDQVQNAIPGIIDAIGKSGCRPRRIIATGHSLGGGLGQHVAFADSRIGYVYAFDPSPVTGWFGIPVPVRMTAAEKLGIDRIYESAEVLSLPRYLASGIFPSPACQPRVRIVRFATIPKGGLVERHRITSLAEGIERLAQGRRHGPLPVAFKEARNCVLPPAKGG